MLEADEILAPEVRRPNLPTLSEGRFNSLVASGADLRVALNQAYRSGCENLWLTALLLAHIKKEHLYRLWEDDNGRFYSSVNAFVCGEIPGLSPSTVSKLVRVGEFVASLPSDLKTGFEELSPYRAYEVLPLAKKDPVAALELAASTGTDHRVKTAVEQQVQHLEPEEFFAIHADMPASYRPLWDEAVAMARFHLNKKDPNRVEIIEAMLASYVQERLPEKWEKRRAAVLAGELYCRLCGSYDVSSLHGHHLLQRSHGGHDGPIILLCFTCHEDTHQHRNGGPKVVAAKLGYDWDKLLAGEYDIEVDDG